MHLIDTHCHVHDPEFTSKYDQSVDEILEAARELDVKTFICVGTDVASSQAALEFCQNRADCYPTLAIHPHEARTMGTKEIAHNMALLRALYDKENLPVAIGECGLDYYYHKDAAVIRRQIALFRAQIEWAQELDLPLVFHIRDAFEDFFRIVDEYKGVRGAVHSFTATEKELTGVVSRGFYVGLNGIMTFTKDESQLAAARAVPIENLVIETDAPFLTPKPFRGKMCEPKHVINITQFLGELRGESQAFLAEHTTKNAKKLFNL